MAENSSAKKDVKDEMEPDKAILLKNCGKSLRAVVESVKEGVPTRNIQRDYESMCCERLPFREFGCQDVDEFIRQYMSDDLEMRKNRDGETVYVAKPKAETAHLAELISKQRSQKKKPGMKKGKSYLNRHTGITNRHSVKPSFGFNTKPSFGSNTKPSFGSNTKPSFGSNTKPSFGSTSKSSFGFDATHSSHSSTQKPLFTSHYNKSQGFTSTNAQKSSFQTSRHPLTQSSRNSQLGATTASRRPDSENSMNLRTSSDRSSAVDRSQSSTQARRDDDAVHSRTGFNQTEYRKFVPPRLKKQQNGMGDYKIQVTIPNDQKVTASGDLQKHFNELYFDDSEPSPRHEHSSHESSASPKESLTITCNNEFSHLRELSNQSSPQLSSDEERRNLLRKHAQIKLETLPSNQSMVPNSRTFSSNINSAALFANAINGLHRQKLELELKSRSKKSSRTVSTQTADSDIQAPNKLGTVGRGRSTTRRVYTPPSEETLTPGRRFNTPESNYSMQGSFNTSALSDVAGEFISATRIPPPINQSVLGVGTWGLSEIPQSSGLFPLRSEPLLNTTNSTEELHLNGRTTSQFDDADDHPNITNLYISNLPVGRTEPPSSMLFRNPYPLISDPSPPRLSYANPPQSHFPTIIPAFPPIGQNIPRALNGSAAPAYQSNLTQNVVDKENQRPMINPYQTFIDRVMPLISPDRFVWADHVVKEYLTKYQEEPPADFIDIMKDSQEINVKTYLLCEMHRSLKDFIAIELKYLGPFRVLWFSEKPKLKKGDVLEVYVSNVDETIDVRITTFEGREFSEELLYLESQLAKIAHEPLDKFLPQTGCLVKLEIDVEDETDENFNKRGRVHNNNIEKEVVYNRAKILDVQGDKAVVHCLDHGGKETVNTSQLFQLPSDYNILPYQAITVALTGLQDITYRDMEFLSSYILGNNFIAVVDDVSPISVTLLNNLEDGLAINKKIFIASMEPVYPIDGRETSASVSFVDEDGSVFLHFPGRGLDALRSERVQQSFESYIQKTQTVWNVGDVCVSKSKTDSIWKRVKIIEVLSNKVAVQFVDYGFNSFVNLEDLKKPNSDEMDIPFQAIKCDLKNLASINWTSMANRRLRELLPLGISVKAFVTKENQLDPVVDIYVSSDSITFDSITSILESDANLWVTRKLSLVEFPKQGDKVRIVHAEHPGQFKGIPCKYHEEFVQMMMNMKEFYHDQEKVALDKKWIVDGELYAVYCSFDSFWYRARIRTIENDKLYIINYVDMGDIFSVTGDEVHLIKELPDSFRQLPMLALSMQLAGVKSRDVQNESKVWGQQVSHMFRELIQDRNFEVYVHSSVRCKDLSQMLIVPVTLCNPRSTENPFIHSTLVECGLAQPTD